MKRFLYSLAYTFSFLGLFAIPLAQAKHKNHAPLTCQGNQDLVVNNIVIKTNGVGITVKGNCTLRITNSLIIAGKIGIKVQGNGDINVVNSTVRGKTAVFVTDQGDVYGWGSRFSGRIIERKNGDFHGKKITRKTFSPPPNYKRSKPIVCKGNQDIKLTNRWIFTQGTGIVSKGNCDIVLTNCWIVAGGYALKATGNGDIKLKNCFIMGYKGAVLVAGNGDVTTKKSEFHGKITTKGSGDFNKKGGNKFHKH